jgi:hypothetical protein
MTLSWEGHSDTERLMEDEEVLDCMDWLRGLFLLGCAADKSVGIGDGELAGEGRVCMSAM